MGEGRQRRYVATLVVVIAGLVITGTLTAATKTADDDNEARLLGQRAEEVTTLLTTFLPGLEAPLATTAQLVDSDADVDLFTKVMGTQVGPAGPLVSAALLPIGGREPLAVVGGEPSLLGRDRAFVDRFLARAAATERLSIVDLIDRDSRVGYAFHNPGGAAKYLIYGELQLPPTRTTTLPEDTAFSSLRFAAYLDTPDRSNTLLLASTSDLPLDGHTARRVTDIGDARLVLEVSPAEHLGGNLLAALPWIVAVTGLVMTIGAAGLTARLQRRRGEAEGLAVAVSELYAEQRTASVTLQQSLLPRQLPDIEGIDVEVRYSPGVAGTEVGGDWYDVIDLGRRTVFVVGDVSGRGLTAASVMAAVRHTVRAFASEGEAPAEVLRKANASGVIDLADHFATVLCAVVDRDSGAIEVATAGHPPPVVAGAGGDARLLPLPVGRPIGTATASTYESVSVPFARGDVLLLFTDGLFERRGEPIDAGLERLRRAVVPGEDLGSMVDGVFDALGAGTNHDDAAILAARWTA